MQRRRKVPPPPPPPSPPPISKPKPKKGFYVPPTPPPPKPAVGAVGRVLVDRPVGIVTQLPSLHQELKTKAYRDKPIGWSPVKELETVKTKTEKYTHGEYRQATYDETKKWSEYKQQVKTLEEQRASIDLSKFYEYDDQIVGGDYVIRRLDIEISKHKSQAEKGYESAQEQYIKALGLKPYERVREVYKETPSGKKVELLGFQISTDVEAKAQQEWKELGKPKSIWDIGSKLVTGYTIPQAGKAAYVGATQWPATLWESFTSPITGKPAKEYGKELVEWEAGTWEQAKSKDYLGFIGSTLTTPAMIEVYMLGLMKGASVVARPASRAGIRAGVHVASKASRFAGIPASKIVSKIPYGSKLISPGFKTVAKRSYQWGAKGYKFGYRLAPGSTQPIRRTALSGLFPEEHITQKLTYGKSFERAWMSPVAQKAAAKRLASKLGLYHSELTFPKATDVTGVSRYSTVMKETRLVGKKLVTQKYTQYAGLGLEAPVGDIGGYTFRTVAEHKLAHGLVESPIFKGLGVTKLFKYRTKELYGLGMGIFQRRPKPEIRIGIGLFGKIRETTFARVLAGSRPTKLSAFSEMFKKGHVSSRGWAVDRSLSTTFPYKELVKGKTLGAGTFEKGWGGDIIRETFAKPAQRAAEKYSLKHAMRHPFYLWKTEKAIQPLIMKPTTKHIIKTPSTGFVAGRLGVIQRLQAPIIPASIPTFELPILYGVTKITGEISIPRQREIVSPTIISRRKRAFAMAPVSITGPSSAMRNILSQDLEQIPTYKQAKIQTPQSIQGLINIQDVKQVSGLITTTTPVAKPLKQPTVYSFVSAPAPIIFPLSGLYGYGRRFPDKDYWRKRFLYREFFVPTLGATSDIVTKAAFKGLNLGIPKKKTKKRKRK